MQYDTALIVDDVAADRHIAALPLRDAGWSVYLARHSQEALHLLQTAIPHAHAAQTLILTDLHMPNDPIYQGVRQELHAGSTFALALRTRMERGDLPRMPIVALTALTEREVHLTALAFGCDAVLPKPAPLDLPQRLDAVLRATDDERYTEVGALALLGLLRSRLAEAISIVDHAPQISEQDITKALLAYHRQGLIGLGQTALARLLAPGADQLHTRGTQTYQQLLKGLDAVLHLGITDSVRLLAGELRQQVSPAEQCRHLGLSLSEYYRRRREAIKALFAILVEQ